MSFENKLFKDETKQKNIRFNEITLNKMNEAIATITKGKIDLSYFIKSANEFLIEELEKYSGKEQLLIYESIKYDLINLFKIGKSTPKSLNKSVTFSNNILNKIEKICKNLNNENFSDFERVACQYALADLIKNKKISKPN